MPIVPDPARGRRASPAARLCLACLSVLHAADPPSYPPRPVRAIVPYAPGGGTDILARGLGQKLSQRWGQQMVTDNRGGGGTIIGTDLVAKSPPDGYTVLITATSFVI